MIGGRIRSVVPLVAAALLVGIPFSQRPTTLAAADPPRHATAVSEALSATRTADDALASAADALTDAIDAARRASANASTATTLDEPRFVTAGTRASAAAAPLAAARLALGRVAGRCAALDLQAPQLAIDPGRAISVGQEIEDSSSAAAAFIGLRTDTSLVLDELASAAAALADADHAAALRAADRAAEATARVEPFAVALPALRLWLETSGDLQAAVRDAASALRDGDAAAAAAAQERLRDAGSEAAVADRALALAISEGASRVLGTQLGQLAALARDVADARSALASLRSALLARSPLREAP